MMIFSAKLTKAKLLTMALVCSCLVLLLLISLPSNDIQTSTQIKSKTNEERIAFLKTYGWEVKKDAVEIADAVIPSVFDSTYDSYNKLQQQQGFDLSAHKGKQAIRYTYEVTNYPVSGAEKVYANVIVLNDTVIGGDISSVSLGGFMHGFEKPSDIGSALEQVTDAQAQVEPDEILAGILDTSSK